MKLIIKKYMPIVISAMLLFLFAACLPVIDDEQYDRSARGAHTLLRIRR